MALGTNQLYSSRDFSGRPRMVVERNKVGTIGPISGDPTLPVGTPLAWNSSTSKWDVYTQPSDAAVYTITAASTTATDGTFDILIDGLVVAGLDHDASAATIEAAINAVLADAGKGWTVSAAATTDTLGDNSGVVTLTFAEAAGAPTVAIDVTDLSGNAHVLAASDAGTALNGTNVIAGFVAHQSVTADATDDVQATVMLAGEVHRDDINTSAIRAVLGGSPSEGELDTALKASSLRDKGITVRGLAAVEG